MKEKANTQLESALDNNEYDESQLVSIKIPVSYLPYYNNSPSFERVNGQVEIQGMEYKYVKRRIYNDSLELLCLPNATAMKSKAAKNEILKFLNDLQHPEANKSAGSHHKSNKTLSLEYYTHYNDYKLNGVCRLIQSLTFHYSFRISSNYHLVVEQPPENA